MKKIAFNPSETDGKEQVMLLGGLNVTQIRFNPETRGASIVCEDPPGSTVEELGRLNWREIKDMVIESGGEWSNKADGIEYLLGVTK